MAGCRSYRFTMRACGSVVAISVLCGISLAQNSTNEVDSVTKSFVQARLDAIPTNANLSEAEKANASRLYSEILIELDKLAALTATRDGFAARVSAIDEDRAAIANKLNAEPAKASIDTSGLTIDGLEEQVRKKQADLETANSQLAELEAAPENRDKRRAEFPQAVAALTDRLEKPPADRPDANAPPEVTEANRLLNLVQRRNAELELEAINQEKAFYAADVNLIPQRIELSRRNALLLADELKLSQNAAARRRQQDRDSQTVDAEAVAAQTSPELIQVAEANLALTEEGNKIAKKIKVIEDLLQATKDRANEMTQEFEAAKNRLVDETRVTESIGDHLRGQRAGLPSVRTLRSSSRARRVDIYDVRDRRFELGQELAKLSRIEASVDAELKNLPKDVTTDRLAEIEPELRSLLERRRELLARLRSDYGKYLGHLVDVNSEEERQIVVSQRFREFVNEKVLWIRSTRPASISDLQECRKALASLVSDLRMHGGDLLKNIPSNLIRRPLPQAIFLAAAIALLFGRPAFTRRIAELGETASRSTCLDFSVTAKALMFTVLRATAGPAVLTWLGLNLSVSGDLDESTIAYGVSRSMFTAALTLLGLSLWSNLIRPGGLGASHLDWSNHVLVLTRRHLRWFTPTIVIAWSVAVYSEATKDPSWERSVGRFSVIVGLIALAWFLYTILSPKTGVFQQYLAEHPTGWSYRLRFLWYPLIAGIPIVFAGFALAGYVYTAKHLVDHLWLSLSFLGGLLLLEALGLRWIRLSRRELALAQARERLAASATGDDTPPSERTGGVVEDEQLDLNEVNQQTRRLFTSFGIVVAILGLHFIWVDVLPALAKLDEINLWRTTHELTQSVSSSADGTDLPAGAVMRIEVVEWITLRNLLGAVLIVFLMFVAIRNIPGLLEIAILQYLPLDAALRFAITTVTRYAIILAGSAAAFGALGIGWSKIQWLVAAVSVGLGFGLQEIFANFVSGLILLFERPLRAGDIVTVGNITGKVVQIKTRATTIQDWDRKELVVPNKEFITSHLLNWTLTDTTNRLVILVGVAYGSDVQKARQIVLDVANDHPLILADPAPSVTFDQFADSALNLTLRAYLPNMDNRLSVTHELHEAIHDRLAEAGIKIPFPQRDLHLRNGDGSIRIVQSDSEDE